MIDGVQGYNVQTNIETDRATIDGLQFTRDKSEGFWMKGSLHKFHNKGAHNADDFRYTDLVETVYRLQKELSINPETTQISRVEFGVNITLPIDAYNVIDSVVLFRNDTGGYDNVMRTFQFSDYVFKIYNKSKQSDVNDNIIRVEVKVTRLRYLKQNKIHVQTLADLLDENVLNGLKRVLVDAFKDCLIIDVPKEKVKKLTTPQRLELAEYTNPIFWNRIRRDKTRNITREKNKCLKFIDEIGGTDLKEKLLAEITDKCDYLLNFSELESVRIFHQNSKQKNSGVSGFSILDDSMKNLTNTPAPNIINCAGCGAIINNPRKGQRFCSAKVVGYEKAHRCRNNVSNPKNNTQRSIRNVLSIPLMFDLRDMIDNKKEKYLDAV